MAPWVGVVFAADLRDRQRSKVPTFELAAAIPSSNSPFFRHAPDLGGTLAQLGDRLAGKSTITMPVAKVVRLPAVTRF